MRPDWENICRAFIYAAAARDGTVVIEILADYEGPDKPLVRKVVYDGLIACGMNEFVRQHLGQDFDEWFVEIAGKGDD